MHRQRVGYIRVSALDQYTERQLEGIEVDKTFLDKASGKNTKRPQLDLLMSFVRSGDTVIVHSMDRLARNLDDLRRIVQTLTGLRQFREGVIKIWWKWLDRRSQRSKLRWENFRQLLKQYPLPQAKIVHSTFKT